MKQRSLFILFVMLFLSGVAAGQTPTVTGKDLEKFRQKRLEAERHYRENYLRMGLPSPEELEQRRVADKEALIELSSTLRRERYEREMRQAENARRAYVSSSVRSIYEVYVNRDYSNGYYLPYYVYGRRPYRRHRGQMWSAGGGGLVYQPGGLSSYVWSQPNRNLHQRRRGPGAR